MTKTNASITIEDVQVAFSNEPFRVPLKMSTGEITTITYAEAQVTVRNRNGRRAVGVGGVLLSDLWAFPDPTLSHEEKDGRMRQAMLWMKEALLAIPEEMDPFELSHHLDQVMQEADLKLPLLALLICASPFDAALHDGWAKAEGRSAYTMYNADYLNRDLGYYLGSAFTGLYPGQFLAKPPERLKVQHVVGAGDPLRRSEIASRPDDALPLSLDEWIERDHVSAFKLKTKGVDPEWDAERVTQVYGVAVETLRRLGIDRPVRLTIDPNEACPTPEPLLRMLELLKTTSPDAYDALHYIEQPTGRRLDSYTFTMHDIAAHKPVVVDESLDDFRQLPQVREQGWSGVALKTCKGHSHALLVYCWAKHHGLFVSVQDLTNPGIALVHSAVLFSHLDASTDAFEFNSRQYIPASRPEVQQAYDELFRVRDGYISLAPIAGVGLY